MRPQLDLATDLSSLQYDFTMIRISTVALLCLGLGLGLQSCTTDAKADLAPAASAAPHAMQTAKFILDDVP